MSSRAPPPRVLVLAAVVAVHAGVILLLLAETRSRLVQGDAEASRILVMLLQPAEPLPAAASRARPSALRYAPSAAAQPEAPPPAAPVTSGAAIDWTAEATTSAARQLEADERRARQGQALAPQQGLIFTPRARRPEFHWDYARTHRVESVPGLETIIHLSDECAIVLFVIVPFAGGCALEKAPARGDLFEHMHDTEPAADP